MEQMCQCRVFLVRSLLVVNSFTPRWPRPRSSCGVHTRAAAQAPKAKALPAAEESGLAMRHAGGAMGPDVENGGIVCMKKLGVREPKSLVRSAITSATEVATAILRIDDVIGRRGE